VNVVFKGNMLDATCIADMCHAASISERCVGVVVWAHTFSPGLMWVRGLKALNKPLMTLHTQIDPTIPWATLDMDRMNLVQTAHGDRELNHILKRMHIRHKIVVGDFNNADVHRQIGTWTRAACAWNDWQYLSIAHIGQNMRNVSVTQGDWVEAAIRMDLRLRDTASTTSRSLWML